MRMYDDVATLSPGDFERLTEVYLRALGGSLREFQTTRLEQLSGTDGVYEIDITIRFEALGVNFIVLVECKHHRSPIKRDVVQILHDRLESTGSQKGILFSTAPFQRGAVQYANAHGIALVHVTNGSVNLVARSASPSVTALAAVSLAVVTVDGSGEVTYTHLADMSRERARQAFGLPPVHRS